MLRYDIDKHKYFFIQSWGLIPLLIVIFIDHYYQGEYVYSIIGGIGGISFLLNTVRFCLRKKFSPMLGLVGLVLMEYAFFLSVFDFALNVFPRVIICGVLLFLNLLFVSSFKEQIKTFVYNWYSGYPLRGWINTIIYEFYYISVFILYVISIYLAFIIIFNTYFSAYYEKIYDFAVFEFQVILIIFFFAYEYIRMIMVRKMLLKEIWLPIIDEEGNILGRVERNESFFGTVRYLHPHVRIAVLIKGKLFLATNDDFYAICGENKIDHPFTGDVFYGESLEDCAKRLMHEKIGKKLDIRFLLRTPFVWKNRKRIVFLFVAYLDTDDVFINSEIKDGRLWTADEIREYISTDKFCDCLVDEIDFLEKIVIPAYNLKK